MKEAILKNLAYSYNFARTLNFSTQGAMLPIVDQLITGQKKKTLPGYKEHLQMALPKLKSVLKNDAENIAAGFYPPSVLLPEMPWAHFGRLPSLVMDAVRAGQQKKKKQTAVFAEQSTDFLSEVPEYFRRNFHFQDGGYLSDQSAQLYDHQVEILFSGTAQAMRRQLIPHIKKHFQMSDGEGLSFLELASGTGSLTRAMALAFPKAKITCVDLSPHYLSYAKKRLAEFRRIDYIQGAAENLNFKDESFDAVFSCYLFHELPENVRHQVIREKRRVLRKSGFLGLVDSIQKDDDESMNWALQQFPVDFHEPFYKNYTEKNLEEALKKEGFSEIKRDIAFLTKVISTAK